MIAWQPSSDAGVAARRAAMLARVRAYFAEHQVLAVDTPAISDYPTSDPNIDSLALASGAYLHTSPESAMKCLLAAGYPDIYAISRVFRGGERGHRHLPEFTLLEWYRHGFDLPAIVADTCQLIARCLDRPELVAADAVHDYAGLYAERLGIDVFEASVDELAAAADVDADLQHALGQQRDAWLDYLLVTKLVPDFAAERLTVLQHYPVAQGALARTCPTDPRVADRFEVFYGGLELANGYVELTDAAEQRTRFARDATARARTGQASAPADELLLAALAHGLPACAGVAVGFERLQMIHEQTDNIADVVTFTQRSRATQT